MAVGMFLRSIAMTVGMSVAGPVIGMYVGMRNSIVRMDISVGDFLCRCLFLVIENIHNPVLDRIVHLLALSDSHFRQRDFNVGRFAFPYTSE